VTLLALHQYLGLGSELIASKHRGSRSIKAGPQALIIHSNLFVGNKILFHDPVKEKRVLLLYAGGR
jgi:hypothetical protein